MLQEIVTACARLGGPPELEAFRKHLSRDWIEEALRATGTATLRRRRLPAEQVVWLVLGMALFKDRSITDVVNKLDLALPGSGTVTVAPSAISQARARLGQEPVRWLFEQCANKWAHQSADGDRWRGLALYGVDGTRVACSRFGGKPTRVRTHCRSPCTGGQRLSRDASGRVDGASFTHACRGRLWTLQARRAHLCAATLE